MTEELERSDDPFAVDLTPSSLRSRSAAGSVSVGLSQLLRAVLQLGVTVVLARLLFPDDYGLVAMVYPVVGFIQLFSNLGVGEVVVQRRTLANEQVSSLFWLGMWVSTALTVLIAVAAPITALAYGEPRVTLLMIAIGATLPLSSVGIVPTALLLRQMRFNVIATTELISGSLGAVVTVVAAVGGLGYWALVVGQVTSVSVQSVLMWSQVQWRPIGPRRSRRARGDLSFGANLTGAQFATFLTTSGDNAIVGIVNGKTALGLYDRSYRLVVQPLGQALAPISRVSIPLLSRLYGDDVEYKRTFLMMLRTVLLLSVPPMVLSIVHSRQLVLLLLGSRWIDAAPIFAWVSVGGLVSGLYASMGWLFISQSRSREWLHYSFLAAGLSVGSFAVGSHWGVLGVAVANGLVFSLLTTPTVLIGASRHGPVNRRDVLGACLPYVVASLAAAALGLALPDLTAGRFVSLCVASVVTYAPFAVLAFSSATERLVFAGLVRTLRRRATVR